MRILVYGAGVIGSLYAALFSNAGFHTTVYARGSRLETLQKNGLLYNKKGKIQKANVQVISHLDNEDEYDYIFLTVREEQLHNALEELRDNCSSTIVTMVNTIEKYSAMEQYCGKGRILPAFPGAGGSIENGVLDAGLTPWIVQPTTFGEINGDTTKRVRILSYLFQKSGVPYQVVRDMHKWQLSHLGMVVPIADAYYKSEHPEQVYKDRKIMMQTARQMKLNFRWLASQNSLSPRKFYLFMICPSLLFRFILSRVFKSKFGYKFLYQHSMKAQEEMARLHKQFYAIIGDSTRKKE